MKIVHIESGLGNQMLSYCEYLALRWLHPDEDIYIETIVFDTPEAHEVINQWNGYELERVFGINAPNVRELFSERQWAQIMKELHESDWWDKNWNYPVYFTRAFQHAGLALHNIRGDFEQAGHVKVVNMKDTTAPSRRERFFDTALGAWVRRYYRWHKREEILRVNSRRDLIFYKGNDDVFTGQWLALKYRDSGLDQIEDLVRQTFVFPEMDARNREMAQVLEGCNSVAIHARRGDMLGVNGYCYRHGYFKRAVKHIRRHVSDPTFVFFCDPGSVDWCKENEQIFGLDFKRDKVMFVDWNAGEESYRDMQLMSHCKHAIITISSFGWWGAFFIKHPGKITISPKEECMVNTTYHC